MTNNTSQSKRVRVLLLILSLLLVVETVWLFNQRQDIQKLHLGNFRIVNDMIEQLIGDINFYSETQDPALLGQIRVRFLYLEMQTQRTIEFLEKPLATAIAETPSTAIYLMMTTKQPPDKIATHLQNYKELLLQYRDRKVPFEDIERHQTDLMGFAILLREAASRTVTDLK